MLTAGDPIEVLIRHGSRGKQALGNYVIDSERTIIDDEPAIDAAIAVPEEDFSPVAIALGN